MDRWLIALGRHRAERTGRARNSPASSEFAFWGIFVTGVTCGSLTYFGTGPSSVFFITSVLAVGFLTVGLLGRSDTGTSSPVGTVPNLPAHPSFNCGTDQSDRPDPVEPASRWIDTFGPPETGQLPIQKYVPLELPAASGGGDGLPQWSHSRM